MSLSGMVVTYGYDVASHLTGFAYTLSGNPVGDLTYTTMRPGSEPVSAAASREADYRRPWEARRLTRGTS